MLVKRHTKKSFFTLFSEVLSKTAVFFSRQSLAQNTIIIVLEFSKYVFCFWMNWKIFMKNKEAIIDLCDNISFSLIQDLGFVEIDERFCTKRLLKQIKWTQINVSKKTNFFNFLFLFRVPTKSKNKKHWKNKQKTNTSLLMVSKENTAAFSQNKNRQFVLRVKRKKASPCFRQHSHQNVFFFFLEGFEVLCCSKGKNLWICSWFWSILNSTLPQKSFKTLHMMQEKA